MRLALICGSLLWLLVQPGGPPGEIVWTKQLADKYNAQGETLWDKTRVDLVNDEYAIEVDFASHKQYEAIGQALYYSIVTGKKPAIILLRRTTGDEQHIYRCQTVCAKYGIKLFIEEWKPERKTE